MGSTPMPYPSPIPPTGRAASSQAVARAPAACAAAAARPRSVARAFRLDPLQKLRQRRAGSGRPTAPPPRSESVGGSPRHPRRP